MEKKYIYLDCETTGLDKVNDRLISLYILDTDSLDLDLKFNPQKSSSEMAISKHGITDELAKTFKLFKDQLESIENYFKLRPPSQYVISGFNILGFDIPMLQSELDRNGSDLNLLDYEFEDILYIERSINDNRLESVYRRYTGMELLGAHDAKNDVIASKIIHEHQMKLPSYSKELGSIKSYDLEGKINKDSDGLPIWNFGKHKNKSLYSDLDYLKWYLSTGVPSYLETKIRNDYTRYVQSQSNK